MSCTGTLRTLVVCLGLAVVSTMLPIAAFAQSTGAVFVNANAVPNNAVWMYQRASSGTLSLVGTFSTQGSGMSPGLGSQGGVALALNNKFVYAVNAGTNDVTGFQITASGLTFVSKTPSGGTYPNSIAIYGSLLYVLNSQGTAANISGFRIQSNGTLRPIANSTRALSTSLPKPGQIGFSPDGKTLLVTEINTSIIDTFAIGTDGRPSAPNFQPSAGAGPFAFAFDNAGHLIVAEVTKSSASSYTLSNGILNTITGELLDFGKAACWLVNTNNANLPQQYSYITNTGSDTVTGLAIASNGAISLLDPADGITAQLLPGAFPLDMAISKDSRYLYVLEGKLPGIAGFQIRRDGSLAQIQDLRGIPTTSYGMIGY